MNKPRIVIDFDGPLHSYISGWKGPGIALDPPTPGALEFLFEATQYFRCAVHSSRSASLSGQLCLRRYCRQHFNTPLTFSSLHSKDFLYEELEFPIFKPPATLYIDDRGFHFQGRWPSIEEIKSFRPWKPGQ